MSKQSAPVAAPNRCSSSLVSAPLSEDQADGLALTFKALADPVRLRLVSMVAAHPGGEACVCDLTPAFDLSQPTISHHLRVLREANLLECERRGTWVYYRVVPAARARLATLLGAGEPDPATPQARAG